MTLLSLFVHTSSDLYEGTRMARTTDVFRIKQLVQPLEESGALVRRTEEEVCADDYSLSFDVGHSELSVFS